MNRELSMSEACPSFEGCSCNECPLDPLAAIHGGPRFAMDGEEDCKATKATRERIARDHVLLGSWAWLPRERDADARRRRWENLTDAERERRAAALLRGPAAKASGRPVTGDSNGDPAPDTVGAGRTSPPATLDRQPPSEPALDASGGVVPLDAHKADASTTAQSPIGERRAA